MDNLQQLDRQPIDVLMPAHGNLHLTMRAVDALYRYTRVPFHLIVVDDSTDLTPTVMRDWAANHQNMTYIHSDVPYKSGNQIFNVGLAEAKNEYVALVMNSVQVEPDWETAALRFMRENPKAAVVGLKSLQVTGMIEHAGIAFIHGFHPIDIGNGLPGHRLSGVYECIAIQWAFCIVRRQALGHLDENTYHGFRGWDDVDNCFVLRKAGWRIFYCGLGAGYHETRATRANETPEGLRHNAENAEIFRKRWGYWEAFRKANPQAPEYFPNKPDHAPNRKERRSFQNMVLPEYGRMEGLKEKVIA